MPINKYNPSPARLAEMDNYSAYGNALSTVGTGTTPFLPVVGVGLQAAGLGLSAYGAYKQQQQAEQAYELAMEQYRREQERQRKIDAQNLQQQSFQNNLASGQYATNQVKDVVDPYLAYARSIGR